MLKLTTFLKNKEVNFQPYNNRLYNFKQITIINSIVYLFSLPFLFFKNPEISNVYYNIVFGYVIVYPIVILLVWIIPSIRSKFYIFFIFLIYVFTLYVFIDLVEHNFQVVDIFSFFCLYVICIFMIQQFTLGITYVIFVLSIFLYSFLFIDGDQPLSKNLILFYFSAISFSAFFSFILRNKNLKSLYNFNTYLKKVSQGNKFGFFIFIIENNLIEIIDYDDELGLAIFGDSIIKTKEEISLTFNKSLTLDNIEKISSLTEGNFFTKIIQINNKDLELTFSPIFFENKKYYLIKINDISAIIKSQEKLRLSEEKYRKLYNENQAGVFTLDSSFNLINFNSTFNLMFDKSFTKDDLFITDESDRIEILDILKEENKLINYQTHITIKDTIVKWLVINFYYDFNNNLIEGTVLDVSEIQKVNNEHRLSEEKFKMIYEDSNDAILIINDDKIIDVNRRGVQLFGIPKDELINLNLWNLTYKDSDDFKSKLKLYLNKLKYSRTVKFSWVFAGRFEPIEAEVAIVELVIGKQKNYQCIIHDVTEKNKAFKALEKSTQNFQSVLDSTPEGIIILKDKTILYANKEVYSLLGKDTIDINNLFIDTNQVVFDKLISSSLTNKYQNQFELISPNSNHTTIPVFITLVNTIFGPDEAILVMLKDVSLEIKLSKEKLRASIAEDTSKRLEIEIKDRIKTEKEIQNLLLKTQAIFDSSSNIILITIDLNKHITYFNKHSKNFFSQFITKELEVGLTVESFFKEFSSLPIYTGNELKIFNDFFSKVIEGKFRQFEFEIKKEGVSRWIEVFLNPIYDTEGNVSEVSFMSHDITLKKESERHTIESLNEKEVLLKEIHHRVKNNLQVISSILNLQSSFVTDPNTLIVLKESRNRIHSMAIIHENLYQTKNFSSIDFGEYIKNLVLNLNSLYYRHDLIVDIHFDLDKLSLSIDQAVPSGLIMNELITNVFKYAFVSSINKKNKLNISTKVIKDTIHIRVKDNGIGLPVDFDLSQLDSLGLQLVVTLCEQLDATLEYKVNKGTEFFITFKKL